MAAVASLRSEPPLQWMYRLPPVEFNDAQPPNLDAGDDEFEYGRLELNWQSVVALLLLVTGLVSAWVTVIAIAFWPAILLTLVMSAFALRASLREGRRLLIPTATAAIAVVVTIASLSFSGNGGLTGPTGPLPAAGTQTTVIPFPQFASDPDVRHAEWVDVRKASIKQGAYRVEIADAWAGSSPETGSNHYLFVLVRVNWSVGIPGYSAPNTQWNDQTPALLHDAAGTQYEQLKVFERQAQQTDPASRRPVPAAKEVVLTFPPEAASADGLRLEIPAAAWGGTANLKFALPHRMIRR